MYRRATGKSLNCTAHETADGRLSAEAIRLCERRGKVGVTPGLFCFHPRPRWRTARATFQERNLPMMKLADTVFKPNRQESKAQTTDSAARAIIDHEAAQREAKTAKLRAARLAMEASQPEVETPPAKKKKPAAKAKR
jgi:hypothetical protein